MFSMTINDSVCKETRRKLFLGDCQLFKKKDTNYET